MGILCEGQEKKNKPQQQKTTKQNMEEIGG